MVSNITTSQPSEIRGATTFADAHIYYDGPVLFSIDYPSQIDHPRITSS